MNRAPSEIPCAIVGRAPTAEREPIELDAESCALEIRVDGARYTPDEGVLRFSLYLGYQLPYAFVKRVAYPLNAVVLSIEQPSAGAIGVLRLMDPDQQAPAAPNYKSDDPLVDDPDGAYFGEQHALAMEAVCGGQGRLFVRAALQGLVSNTVELDLDALPSYSSAPIDFDLSDEGAEEDEEAE